MLSILASEVSLRVERRESLTRRCPRSYEMQLAGSLIARPTRDAHAPSPDFARLATCPTSCQREGRCSEGSTPVGGREAANLEPLPLFLLASSGNDPSPPTLRRGLLLESNRRSPVRALGGCI